MTGSSLLIYTDKLLYIYLLSSDLKVKIFRISTCLKFLIKTFQSFQIRLQECAIKH